VQNVIDIVDQQRRETEAEIRRNFADPGQLGLPKTLDDKRVKYGIPNSAWSVHPAFNKVLIWQIPLEESKAYGSGLIQKTDTVLKRELVEAPRGVIVSAGLTALDQLRSHGIDIGHTVVFTHLAPFRLRLPTIAGKEPILVILESEYIFASEELATNVKSRACRVIAKENSEGVTEHFYCDENAKVWHPKQVNTEQF
jgi:hypothetical protein